MPSTINKVLVLGFSLLFSLSVAAAKKEAPSYSGYSSANVCQRMSHVVSHTQNLFKISFVITCLCVCVITIRRLVNIMQVIHLYHLVRNFMDLHSFGSRYVNITL